MNVYAVNLECDFDINKFRALMTYCSKEKIERIKKFYNYEDALRCLVADILVRYVINTIYKIENRKIVFYQNKYGKPFIKNFANIHFNVSHSGSWVVCAVDNTHIGIDIEQIKPIDVTIAEYFCQKCEIDDLMNKTKVAKLLYFYEIWALKESYTKMKGEGLNIKLDSFSIKHSKSDLILNCEEDSKICYFKQYNIDNNYKMSLCSNKQEFPNQVIIKQLNDIYEQILKI